jgi:putative hydrolase
LKKGGSFVLKSDLHIHTVMSGHAFCTVNECVETARKRGLSLIAITDHGPAMEHSAHEGYFKMSTRLPKTFANLEVLFGCEMNILSKSGDVDLSAKTMSNLDIVLAGLHERTSYAGSSEAENTAAIINAMKRHPQINIITHPYRAEFPVSIADIVQAAKEYNVILEINVALLLRTLQHKAESNCTIVVSKTAELVHCLQSTGSRYLINSDAHHSSEIGITADSLGILESELGVCPEFVLNDNSDLLKQFVPSITLCGGRYERKVGGHCRRHRANWERHH